MASQSSSRPLQTSVCGVTVGVSQNVPMPLALQARMPSRRQMPTPVPVHDAPTMKPSSMSPSQSLSRPSQRSVGTAQPHAWPQALRGKPSSTWPSQSSSMQLQLSTAQWRPAAPSRLSGSSRLFGLATTHMFDTPSSIRSLQLSSRPLQISPGGTLLAMMSTSACLTAAVSVRDAKIADPVPPAAAIRLARACDAAPSEESDRT